MVVELHGLHGGDVSTTRLFLSSGLALLCDNLSVSLSFSVALLPLQIILYRWDGSELLGMAFFDGDLSTVSLHSVGNYIMFADIYKSVQLIYWEVRSLLLAA